MRSTVLLAPVTALEFLGEEYLLSGEGPVLSVYSLHTSSTAPRQPGATLSVLRNHRIHGIRPAPRRQESGEGGSQQQPRPHEESGGGAEPRPRQHDEGGGGTQGVGVRGATLEETPWQQVDQRAVELRPPGEGLGRGVAPQEREGGALLAVFGGKAVCVVELREEERAGGSPRLAELCPLWELQDWVWDAHWLQGRRHLAVALAHNAVVLCDPWARVALALSRCAEGCLLYSALLLGPSWAGLVVVGGTVFSQLVLWGPAQGESAGGGGGGPAVQRRLEGHEGVVFGIAYLPESGWLASASDDRSACLWQVGSLGGPAGCGSESPVRLWALYGHQARVFAVRLLRGRLLSAGEDSLCLLWDGHRGSVARRFKGHRAGGVRALAVSEGGGGGHWAATGGADGGIRVWRIGGDGEGEGGPGRGCASAPRRSLCDLRFRGRGSPKVVRLAGFGAQGHLRVVVLTDEGCVYLHSSGEGGGEGWQPLGGEGDPEFRSYSVLELAEAGGGAALCAVGNLAGGVRVFALEQPGGALELRAGRGKVHSLHWASERGRGGEEEPGRWQLFASGPEGQVYRWEVCAAGGRGGQQALGVRPLRPLLLPACAKRWLTAVAALPGRGALWAAGDRRGSVLLYRGAREGRGGPDEPPLGPVSVLFGLHGKQGVTSLRAQGGLLYSTGRDGCVRVLGVRSGDEAEERPDTLEVLRAQRTCRGMDWVERVLFPETQEEEEEEEGGERSPVEEEEGGTERAEGGGGVSPEERGRGGDRLRGATESGAAGGGGPRGRFLVLGFHSVDFVVWDPVRRERLLSVPCGGGHRSWSYCAPSRANAGPGWTPSLGDGFAFIKQGGVFLSRGRGPPLSGFGVPLELKEGVHGRGVACVCRVGAVRSEAGAWWEVLVTGGEDTTLTVLGVQPDCGSVRVLSIIADHISSVRALATVPQPEGETGAQGGGRGDRQTGAGTDRLPDGQTDVQEPSCLSALLFSGGGRAQLQSYRLLIGWNRQEGTPSCQVIQVAGHRLAEQWEKRRNRHKMLKMDPETSIMIEWSVCWLRVTDALLLPRLFSLHESLRRLVLLWGSLHHQRCVLSVAPFSLCSPQGTRSQFLCSAATDGRIALWDLTEVVEGAEGLTAAPQCWGEGSPCLCVPAHQSGVNSLAVWGSASSECLLLASGGDDGSLTVSRIGVQYNTRDTGGASASLRLLGQTSAPCAHAAPLTALQFLTSDLLATVSVDQRVALWRLCGEGRLRWQGALFSHVADAAGLVVSGSASCACKTLL
nr:PREDICTED: WD repeat-containing protein 6 [Lepisosteus oculatus]